MKRAKKGRAIANTISLKICSFLAENIYGLLKRTGVFYQIGKLAMKVCSRIPVPLIHTPDGNWFCFGFGPLREIYLECAYDTLACPEAGWVVVDVGAAVGAYALRASRLVGEHGLVVAVEPNPANFRILMSHIRINRRRNVIPVNAAFWEDIGKIRMSESKHFAQHSVVSGNTQSTPALEVPSVTFDCLMRKLGISRVDFVKMDVEGAEVQVLDGMKETPINNLAIEYHGEKNREKVSSVLRSRGYRTLRSGGKELGLLYASIDAFSCR